jgi:hypothetical protein
LDALGPENEHWHSHRSEVREPPAILVSEQAVRHTIQHPGTDLAERFEDFEQPE